MISPYDLLKKDKTMETEERSLVARVWGERRVNRQSTGDF